MFARVHILISGRVHGILFRAWTKTQAERLGLSGWVRNLPTGQVEITAEGEKSRVEELVKLAHHGPPLAQVETVEVSWENPTEEFTQFEIKK